LNEWDLAFEMTGFSSSIRVNTAKGLVVYETPVAIADWDGVQTVDSANWTRVDNADTSWSVSALNNGNNLQDPDGFNVGWGNYNMATHYIIGSKIRAINFWTIPGKLASTPRQRHLFVRLLKPRGNDYYDEELVKTDFTGKNFGYWSRDQRHMNREPPTVNWDLLLPSIPALCPQLS
jgi:hypothetical protein